MTKKEIKISEEDLFLLKRGLNVEYNDYVLTLSKRPKFNFTYGYLKSLHDFLEIAKSEYRKKSKHPKDFETKGGIS